MTYNYYGTSGNDNFNYTGPDSLYAHGYGGNDFIWGNNGNDSIYGDEGYDTLKGWYGDDFLSGDSGNDALYGEVGNDTLMGWSGNDILNGGDGNDRLDGYATSGSETDTLTGGAGYDKFVLGGWWGTSYKGSGHAVITDWNSAFDYIEINGSASQYELKIGNWVGGSALDTRIYLKGTNDSIAIVQDSTDIQLTTRDFIFV
jgi:Ca2+-binding RTX toxin-like protein